MATRNFRANQFEGLSEIFAVSNLFETPQSNPGRDASRSMSLIAESYRINSPIMSNTYAICGGVLLGGLLLHILSNNEEDNNEY